LKFSKLLTILTIILTVTNVCCAHNVYIFKDPRDKPLLPGWVDLSNIKVSYRGSLGFINLTFYAPPPYPLKFKLWIFIDSRPGGGTVKEVWPYVRGVDYYIVVDEIGMELLAWKGNSFKELRSGKVILRGSVISLKLPSYVLRGRFKVKALFFFEDRYKGSSVQWLAIGTGCKVVRDPRDVIAGIDLKSIEVKEVEGYLSVRVSFYNILPSPLNPPMSEDYFLSITLPTGSLSIDGDGDGLPDYYLGGLTYTLYRGRGLLNWFTTPFIADEEGRVISRGSGVVLKDAITYYIPLDGVKVDYVKAKFMITSSALKIAVGESVPNEGWLKV